MIGYTGTASPDITASRTGMSKRLKTLLIVLALLALMFLACFSLLLLFVATSFTYSIQGDDMLPTLRSGNHVLVSSLLFYSQPPKRGEIIVFTPSVEPNDFIKRVIALPGETVEIKADTDSFGDPNADCSGCGVFIDGIKLNEPYINQTADYNYGPTEVPEGQVFVLGDNRRNSSDSHVWGPLDVSRIKGKALLKYEPFEFLQEPAYH